MINRGYFRKLQRDRENQCFGRTKDKERCSNLGKPDSGGRYWCHVHKVQALSALILQESKE